MYPQGVSLARRPFLSKLWEAITGGSEEENRALAEAVLSGTTPILPENPPPPPREPEPPHVSDSDDNERIANRLIRIYDRNQSPRYRRYGVNTNRIRRNVDRMPDDVKDIARRASADELIMYSRYPEHTDDDGNNFFWYH